MTNAQILQQSAIQNYDSLNSYQQNFVDSIRYYTKKELRNLTSKQYSLLKECAK